MATFYPLSIKSIQRQTPAAVTISFDIPKDLQATYQFIPGQYITIKDSIDGQEVRRAYSICSASTSDVLQIAIKQISNGTFSVKANTQLQSGDVLEVHPPEGTFLLQPQPNHKKTYAAFAAGSGITPIMGMIRTILSEEPESSFVLVYGNKTPEDTIFLKELQALQSSHPERLFIEYFYSQTSVTSAHFGRIENSTVHYILKNSYKNLIFDSFYICGPEEMIHVVKDTLIANNVDNSKIYFELFTSSTETTEIEHRLDGKTQVTVLVDDEEFNFVMDAKKTLLEAALEKDIDAPYSCQGGVCSSCICRITLGKAVMQKNSILTDAELEEGLVLACQAHPTTSELKVDFDDV